MVRKDVLSLKLYSTHGHLCIFLNFVIVVAFTSVRRTEFRDIMIAFLHERAQDGKQAIKRERLSHKRLRHLPSNDKLTQHQSHPIGKASPSPRAVFAAPLLSSLPPLIRSSQEAHIRGLKLARKAATKAY